MSAVRVARDVVAESCERCAETGRTCAACVQRRRYAWSLVTERGETFEAAGRIMGLESYRVRELAAAENDRRELNRLRCNSIPVQRTQSVITEALARDQRDEPAVEGAASPLPAITMRRHGHRGGPSARALRSASLQLVRCTSERNH